MLTIKLHRIHLEVAHAIHEQKGKLVPLAAIRAKFPDDHRVNEALWTLIEQRVAVESGEYKGNYQLTREGAAVVEEQWDKLQADLKKGKKVPMVETDDSSDAARERKEKAEAEAKAAAGTLPGATPKIKAPA